jgi:KDEL-tailed cysteine endopeptidase
MMDNAFRYVIDYGVALESQYGYVGTSGSCKYRADTMKAYSISRSTIIYNDCPGLVRVLKERPVTVVVSVDMSFIFYGQGVLNSCGTSINHAIQLVGYYKNSSSSYYLGKNSWGVAWGQQGFIKIDATLNNSNLCSVCAYPQYPE